MKSRTYLWIARNIWRCENCHSFWMKSFASSKLCRVSLWARLLSFSWAGICNSNLFQILNWKLFAPSSRELSPRHLGRTHHDHHFHHQHDQHEHHAYYTGGWLGAGIIILIDSRPTSFRHLPEREVVQYSAPIIFQNSDIRKMRGLGYV